MEEEGRKNEIKIKRYERGQTIKSTRWKGSEIVIIKVGGRNQNEGVWRWRRKEGKMR